MTRAFLIFYSPVAQLVERWTVNPFVVGSSPTGGAFEKGQHDDFVVLAFFDFL